MGYRPWNLVALTFALSLVAATAHGQDRAATITPGDGEQSVSLSGTVLDVFTYRPAQCTPSLLLVVFHGIQRDAGPYRDRARPLADKLCAFVVAPRFDQQRFPRDRYQLGGVVEHGHLVPPGSRSIDLVAPLVAWARNAAGQPGMPYVLIGHSAGAQFVGRVVAFTPTQAAAIVLANPSTWVMPSTDTAAPFGFGGIEPPHDAELALRAYLALPIVVALGGADTGTKGLDMSAEAMAQGPYRLARGQNAFKAAHAVAASRGWPLRWSLIEVPGVGHDAARMLAASQTDAALQPLVHRGR
jgi:dienelactone hydrolase